MNDYQNRAKELVSLMTLKEKTELLSGADKWRTKSVPRVGLPSAMVADGPHGLRKEVDKKGSVTTLPATCFPTACCTACSFDRALLQSIGEAIAEECLSEGVSVILGPGLNSKRSPLCGRNFEYFSEDPVVSGDLAAAYVRGVQSRGVGACIKHFAMNNQEYRRLTTDAVADDRTIFELYLSGFERAISQSSPRTAMCSYNRVKGVNASDNRWLLTDVLRTRFGFDGLVMSDWGAVYDRVEGVRAGLDLEMPYYGPYHDRLIQAAVENGSLSEPEVDLCASRVAELALRAADCRAAAYDQDAHHALARKAAAKSAVLLKNEDDLLPIKPGARVAVIGAFAQSPRYQGAGSSKVVPLRVDSPMEELQKLGVDATYAAGYNEANDAPDETLLAEACTLAADRDVALLMIGLPDRYESEGFDRSHLRLPESHVELVRRVSAVNPNVAVLLAGGSVIDMAWESGAKSIILLYLGGEAVGGAAADFVTGAVSPSGKLAESWPLRLEDTPSYDYFPGYLQTVEYREGLFTGYRYYDAAQKPVRYPFGFGLSYTRFVYRNLSLSAETLDTNEPITVSCDIVNAGSYPGEETAQLYVAHSSEVVYGPAQQLKGFEKISLQPGESKRVSFSLTRRDLAFYDAAAKDWRVEGGAYTIRLSASSRDIRLSADVTAAPDQSALPLPDYRQSAPCYYDLSNGLAVSDEAFAAVLGSPIPPRERKKGEPYTLNVTLSEVRRKPLGWVLTQVGKRMLRSITENREELAELGEHVLFTSPVRLIRMDSPITPLQVEGIVDLFNGKVRRGLKSLLGRQPK